MANILIACEESQAVTKEFRKLGHEAFSCDVIPCSGGFPEWHIQQDVLPLIDGHCNFITCDGLEHNVPGKWDLIIAFPPCTYLTNTGNRWFNVQVYGQKALNRLTLREYAKEFFLKFVKADCDLIAIENPIGYMSTAYRKPNQIIHPYYFGDAERKATCLWLKGLPELVPTDIVEPEIIYYKNGKGSDNPWHVNTLGLSPELRAKLRSKTFPGIARAMASQWSMVFNE